MKILSTVLLLLPLAVFSQNIVCFTIEANPNPADPALSDFTKYINVLDCIEIYAESSISDEKVLHAAAIAAELLDNNEDGIVDDPLIQIQLANMDALMPLFAFEGSAAEDSFFNNYMGEGVSAVLYNNEIDPSQPGHWGDDASVEEVMHTINSVGHTEVYPAAFTMEANSSLLSAAMDVARGGQFFTVPDNYPAEAWYHYDDETCDYNCMATEYMYWSIVSYMGILDDAQTAAGIADEWEPYNATLLETMDVLVFDLITDPLYKLPLLAPDGNYCPPSTSIHENKNNGLLIFPNPANYLVQIDAQNDGELLVINNLGEHILQFKIAQGINKVDLSNLNEGMYILQYEGNSQRLVVKD